MKMTDHSTKTGTKWGAVGGVLLVSLLLCLSAASLVLLLPRESASAVRNAGVVVVMLAVWLAGLHPGWKHWTEPAGDSRVVSLLQGNIPQEKKWKPEMLQPTLDFYIDHTLDNNEAELVLWPESAIPALASQVREAVIDPLREALGEQGKVLVTGVLTHPEPDVYFNTLLALDGGEFMYHKRHLVPFGEYFPLAWLWKESLSGLATMGDDFTASRAPKPLLTIGDLTAGASICYEIAFGEELIHTLPEAAFLINISNDAWFGDSIAPHQHLQIARMRAIETGRYMLRATNTGISAVIAPDGSIVGESPQFETHVLSATIRPFSGATPFVAIGNFWLILPALAVLALVIGARRPVRI